MDRSRALAAAFLAGAWNLERLTARGRAALEPPPRWVRAVAREVLAAYHHPPADRPRELARFIAVVLERMQPAGPPPRVRRWFAYEQRMARRLPWPELPRLDTVGDLAAFLGLMPERLAWLADARGLERRVESERLRNYRYTWLPRAGGPPRVIESPKADLKAVQRHLLRSLIEVIPAHEAAHGFVRGRSVRTHAALHVRSPVVMRFDLEDFFAQVAAGRVYGIFRTAGYSESVAHALTALVTNVVPLEEWSAVPRHTAVHAHHRLGRRLATPHLPQGAPTSPALANLCAFGLDRRLAGLAGTVGAGYSRYADDIVLSGARSVVRVRDRVAEIADDESFRVAERKSQLMTAAGRQRVCGVVVNERPNVTRHEYDLLKAILHNAALTGPAAQNRAGVPDFRAHLLGRISWVESLHPERGRRLRERFERIDWP